MDHREIRQIIAEERRLYVPAQPLFMKISHQKRYLIWKTLSSFRWAQYWKTEMQNNQVGVCRRLFAKLAYRYYFRQRNIYSERSGVEIASHSTMGRRTDIWHGGVIISGHLGNDCVIHGNNVIGSKGKHGGAIPVLGDRVDLGVGAVVIGCVRVADGCQIGANAVVNKDFNEPNCLIVGIPAYVKGNEYAIQCMHPSL